jgi:hypothetical protein
MCPVAATSGRVPLAAAADSEGVIRISLQAKAPLVEPASDLDQAWVPSEALQRYLKRSESG